MRRRHRVRAGPDPSGVEAAGCGWGSDANRSGTRGTRARSPAVFRHFEASSWRRELPAVCDAASSMPHASSLGSWFGCLRWKLRLAEADQRTRARNPVETGCRAKRGCVRGGQPAVNDRPTSGNRKTETRRDGPRGGPLQAERRRRPKARERAWGGERRFIRSVQDEREILGSRRRVGKAVGERTAARFGCAAKRQATDTRVEGGRGTAHEQSHTRGSGVRAAKREACVRRVRGRRLRRSGPGRPGPRPRRHPGRRGRSAPRNTTRAV